MYSMYITATTQDKYVHLYILTRLEGWTVSSPVYFGEANYINFFTVVKVGQAVPTYVFFTMAHPAPPLHLAHTLGGSRLNCPRPTGTYVLK